MDFTGDPSALAEPTALIGFRRHLRTAVVPGDGVCLVSPRRTLVLAGRSAETLASLLDGTRTLAEVVRDAAPELSPRQVGQALGRLAEAGLIGRSRPGGARRADPGSEAFWDLAGLDPVRAGEALSGSAVEVVTAGGVDADTVRRACSASGLTVVDAGTPAAFSLVICGDYLDPELAEVNARQLASGRPWLLASPHGPDVWVGPVFRPGSGPCWSCLAARLRAHRRPYAVTGVRPPDASIPAGRALAVEAAVLEAAKWLAGSRHEGQDTIWALDTLTLDSRRHRLSRRPQCPDCGDPGVVAERVRRPVVPVSRGKSSGEGIGRRALSSAEMWARYSHLADPVTGVVAEIRPDRIGASPSLYRYVSGANLALGGGSLPSLRTSLRMPSGGKGTTELEAKVSALAEAVERYCGSRSGDEPTVRAAYRDLAGRAVHPDDCQLFHDLQYRDRDRWNRANPPALRVPSPFDEHAQVDWTPVWSLTQARQRLMPTALLYYGARAGFGSACSNGNAAGASVEDAIVQGFLELVERDAVAIWWYNRIPRPAVDLSSFDDPWMRGLRTAYQALDREIWALDLTSDLGVPVVAAVSRPVGGTGTGVLLGFGAHFDIRVAVRRAMTELAQLLPAADGGGEPGTLLDSWWRRMARSPQPYLQPDPGQAPCVAGAHPHARRDDLRDDVADICRLAGRHGLDVLVLDQTRPDVGMPVVKVVAPGLRHFWPRLAPGRLFDVPVRMGWRASPTPYERLNPIPLFL
ncbi:TOMM precursor leader peptide-binding protein [Microbispora sp. CA-135349]|uniref:TOMM precursor leader peptide-binding protein n=1 Tax=Microbispora sp. CA-135349 TaxID=3239953 RepID=UPI003D8A1E9E